MSEEPSSRQQNGTADQSADVRGIVLSILVECEHRGTHSNVLIREAQERNAGLSRTQRSFLKRLAEGTIERQIELDGVIRRHMSHPETRVKTVVRCLLRMSVYQIYYMDSVPDFAACSEAVRLCRERRLESQVGFVNAVLRSVCREKNASRGERTVSGGQAADSENRSGGAENARRISGEHGSGAEDRTERWSMPEEILQLWRDQLGEERIEPLCEAMMEIRPVCIRLAARLSPEEKEQTLRDLKGVGVQPAPGRWAPDCWLLRRVSRIADLPGFAEGRWTVQDESSQLTAQAAGLTGRGQDLAGPIRVVDVCAAPGGKTVLAAMLAPEGHVTANDLSREKTDRIRANLRRMRLTNVTVTERDASGPWEDGLRGTADLVICDVPCSGLGVMTRKRDIKYHVNLQQIRSLAALQKRIAMQAASLVKPGGVLLYSTCTINRIENERVADYIAANTSLTPEALAPYLPEDLPGVEGNRVQLFPDVHGTDGFFMARFRKP